MADLLDRPVLEVAPLLLGAVLRHDTDAGMVAVRLTEVEAYDGAGDPGSHAYRGRTDRNAVMFGPPGHAYVYFTYGMHHCMNIVCGPDGEASALLLRAGEVVAGHDLAHERRKMIRERDLARGPARLCSALGITLDDNGVFLESGPLTLTPREPPSAADVSTGTRVGLRQAADRPWRFWLTGEPTVSAYRPATPRPPRRPK